ncbi:ATPase [Aureimonas ureilytica]|uniref:ATPase n=1 Tax=Aureimonas ureilytica TaxID=401562 RepID=A0A175R4M4_9HYPH|nr:ParA family protein [Aureimonas ureilytica]KTQ86755.1 ATPase [Aureimonas ureilytica]
MPVISIANPKGGAGKSTTALILGTVLASKGASTTVLDCDPNQPLAGWSAGGSSNPVCVIGDLTESRIVSAIDEERRSRQVVIVDLEGTASRMVSRAIARSDLVLIPMQASAVDAAQAARAVGLVREEEQLLEREIPLRVIFTRTSPQIPTRNEKMIIEELRSAGIPLLTTHLNERAAYKSVFTYKRALDELDPSLVNGLDGARTNADRLVDELLDVLGSLPTRRVAA